MIFTGPIDSFYGPPVKNLCDRVFLRPFFTPITMSLIFTWLEKECRTQCMREKISSPKATWNEESSHRPVPNFTNHFYCDWSLLQVRKFLYCKMWIYLSCLQEIMILKPWYKPEMPMQYWKKSFELLSFTWPQINF